MTDTAQIPAIEIQAAVYMTAARRVAQELVKFKKTLVDFLNGEVFQDAAEGLERLRRDFLAWLKALRKAHAYKADHRYSRRETFVTKSTPVERRVYINRKPEPLNDPTTRQEWSRAMRTRENNARIIITHSEGPLAP